MVTEAPGGPQMKRSEKLVGKFELNPEGDYVNVTGAFYYP